MVGSGVVDSLAAVAVKRRHKTTCVTFDGRENCPDVRSASCVAVSMYEHYTLQDEETRMFYCSGGDPAPAFQTWLNSVSLFLL